MPSKVKPLSDQNGTISWLIFCPGCKIGHLFDNRWTYNGNAEAPTFRASMLVNANLSEEKNPDGSKKYPNALRCHSFVTDGRIQFLSDCDHSMKNSTVELPDFDELLDW